MSRTQVQVAQDLTAMDELYEMLMAQAIHKAGDRLMPGGEAMVALASVGSPDEWAERVGAVENRHYATCPRLDHTRCRIADHVLDEDGAEPPLQTLLFWSEQWRAEAGYSLDRPTMATEVRFIRANLDWAWTNLAEWEDFANDVRSAKTRLENLLLAGERAVRGVPCMYDECKGARIVRKLEPYRMPDGEKGWRWTKWHCPKCKRSWDEGRYAAMVTAAHEAAKVEQIGEETWCTTDYAARAVGRPPATVRKWLHAGYLSAACIVKGKRQRYVSLDEVRERHEKATRRKRAA